MNFTTWIPHRCMVQEKFDKSFYLGNNGYDIVEIQILNIAYKYILTTRKKGSDILHTLEVIYIFYVFN